MNVEIKNTMDKIETQYKTLYISKNLVSEIEKIAQENKTSFNNVIISMIKHCLEVEKM